MIPLVNLSEQFRKLRGEMLPKIEEVLKSNALIQGKYVRQFEEEFSLAHGARFGIGCSNGTAAISMALKALGVGAGDEVITVPNSFIATVEAIYHVDAKPVFVDVRRDTYLLDVEQLERAITSRTKAILPVHLFGNPADMDAIMAVARKHRLLVIEDCAQAHLATYKGKSVGTFGDAATFSFYPGKNLGAYGDAGFIFVRTAEHDRLVRELLDHGRFQKKYEHSIIGFNNRMDGLQGAVLSIKLKHLAAWTETRRRNAEHYTRLLSKAGFRSIVATPGAQPVYHLFVTEVSNREETIAHLRKAGIECGVHYAIPLHLQPALFSLELKEGDFPVTEAAAKRILSLPMCGDLTAEQIDLIAGEFLKVARP